MQQELLKKIDLIFKDKQYQASYDVWEALDECRDTLTKQAERIATLEAQVHECPKCGEFCKECKCQSERVRALEAMLSQWKEELKKRSHPWDDADLELDNRIDELSRLLKGSDQ